MVDLVPCHRLLSLVDSRRPSGDEVGRLIDAIHIIYRQREGEANDDFWRIEVSTPYPYLREAWNND